MEKKFFRTKESYEKKKQSQTRKEQAANKERKRKFMESDEGKKAISKVRAAQIVAESISIRLEK